MIIDRNDSVKALILDIVNDKRYLINFNSNLKQI